MVLRHLSQAELERAVETLIHNGQLSKIQNAIADVGYDIEALQQADALLNSWRNGLTQAQSLLIAQKQATQAEREARQVAQKEISRLKRTARAIFAEDEVVLRSLGIRPRRTNGTTGSREAEMNGNAPEQSATFYTPWPSRNTTNTIVAWRRTIASAENLNEAQKERLAKAKWPVQRIIETGLLIDAWAQADDRQKEAKQAYREQMAANKAMEINLRKWLKEARELIRVAIEEVDPNGVKQLNAMLGM